MFFFNRTTPTTNGQLIEKNTERIEIKEDGTLEITAVRPSDVGSYACVVTSPGGNETRSARLSVIELPFAPTNGQSRSNSNKFCNFKHQTDQTYV